MTKRKQQAIETKQKLLDTADMLVKERGFDAVSVDDIVAGCGVAKGTFYHYFSSKDDLLVYLTRTPYEKLKQNFAATEGRPYLERLHAFIRDWFHMTEKYNLHFTVLHNRMALTERQEQKPSWKHSQIDEGLSILQSCLQGAVEHGELAKKTPVETLGRMLIFSMQGSALYQSQHADTFDVAAWEEAFNGTILSDLLRPYLPEEP